MAFQGTFPRCCYSAAPTGKVDLSFTSTSQLDMNLEAQLQLMSFEAVRT